MESEAAVRNVGTDPKVTPAVHEGEKLWLTQERES